MEYEVQKIKGTYGPDEEPSLLEFTEDIEDGCISIHDPEEGNSVSFSLTEAIDFMYRLKSFVDRSTKCNHLCDHWKQ